MLLRSPWRDTQNERPTCYCQNCGGEIYEFDMTRDGLCEICMEDEVYE